MWPMLAVYVNIGLSKVIFLPSLLKYMYHFAIVYVILNYMGTQSRGAPLYPFMPWKDWWTLVYATALFSFAVLIMLLVGKLNNWLKGHTPS